MFLTMKVFENTPAVLSLGKLFDENGYSYEWINGQKTYLIKNGIRIQCNTENFVPIVVPGLSSSSSSSFPSSTSMTPSRQESNHPTSPSSSSTSSTTTVSCDSETRVGQIPIQYLCRVNMLNGKNGETCWPSQPKSQNQKKMRVTNRCAESGCKNSERILVDERVLEHRDSHACSSHELSSEPIRLREVRIWVKHRVYTHFPKDWNCEICQRTKITRAPCRRRNGGAVPRAERFDDMITAESQSSQWKMWISKQSSMSQSWCRTWPPNGSMHILAKQKLHKKHREACKSSWSRMRTLKSFTLTIPWNLAKPVKIFPGIIVRQQHTDRKQMGLLKEQCAEWKKAPLRYCCNQVWMKNGGQIPWNVTPICETIKISCLMRKLQARDVLGNHLKDRSFRLVPWLSITLLLRRTSQESINMERKSYLDSSLDTLRSRGEFRRVTYWLQTLRSWNRWTHRKSMQKDWMQRK